MKDKTNIIEVGINDSSVRLFEGQYLTPEGMAYNSYVIIDEKIAVMDTVEASYADEWLAKVRAALDGRKPDYLVVHHMEPDHSANIARFIEEFPGAQIVATAAAFKMMRGFFGTDFKHLQVVVSDGFSLCLGEGTLRFYTAPMVHWPEVAVSLYDKWGVLFSADAFGRFGTWDSPKSWVEEARRYYIGIVGKYGAQVNSVLAKLPLNEIKAIYPLHGNILESDLGYYVGLYSTWASYAHEKTGVTVAHASVYGNTRFAAELLAKELSDRGVEVRIYDLTRCDMADAISSAFMFSHLVLASVTYNADVFPKMRVFLDGITERGIRNRTVAFMENGSWAPRAGKVMKESTSELKDIAVIEPTVSISSAVSDATVSDIRKLAEAIAESL